MRIIYIFFILIGCAPNNNSTLSINDSGVDAKPSLTDAQIDAILVEPIIPETAIELEAGVLNTCGADIWKQIKEVWIETGFSTIGEDCKTPRVQQIETLEETTEICDSSYSVDSCWIDESYIVLWIGHSSAKYVLKHELVHTALKCSGLSPDFEHTFYPSIWEEGSVLDFDLKYSCEEIRN